jgi:hypothetical protein
MTSSAVQTFAEFSGGKGKMIPEVDTERPVDEEKFDVEKYIRERKAGCVAEADDPFTALSLKKTLEMAKQFRERGDTHQALGLYKRLIDEFPDSKEATEAKADITEIAQRLEGEGKHYAALSLYRSLQD